jgi:hypothetical protein
MDQYLEWINKICSSPIITLGSFILAVLGIALAFVFFIKSRRSKKPFYALKSVNIIRDFSSVLSDLTIAYKNEPVKNLTITKIVFWNGGNETIRNNDIAAANPITISSKDESKILNGDIIRQSNKDNLLKLTKTKDGQCFELSFDFLDQEQGGVIQVVHTGISSKDLEVKGTIKGVGDPVLRKIPSPLNSGMLFPFMMTPTMRKKPRQFGYVMMIFLIISSLLGLLIVFFSEKEKVVGWMFSLTYAFAIIPCYILLIKRRVPKSLQIFEENFEIEESTNKVNTADRRATPGSG